MLINRKQLSDCLKLIAPLVKKTFVLPILNAIKIYVDGEHLCVECNNLETFVKQYVPIEKDDSDANSQPICVDFSSLKCIIDNDNTEDKITLSITPKSLTIRSLGEYTISVEFNALDYPLPKEISLSEQTLSMIVPEDEMKQFTSVLNAAIPFVSKDDLRPSMTGINLRSDENNAHLKIAATDGHSLYFNNYSISNKPKSAIDIIIEPYVCSLLIKNKYLSDCTIRVDDKRSTIEFVFENKIIIRSLLIDAKYPTYESVIKPIDTFFFVSRKKLTACLKVASTVNGSNRDLILSVKNAVIKISTRNDAHDTSDTKLKFNIPISAGVDVDSIVANDFCLDAKILLKAINATKDPFVKIGVTATPQSQPAIIDDKVLIMPKTFYANH